ncbi:MAG TPA: alpha/beta hydrolase, partial [Streptosporangiaceae bacterium]|nr:alpha/beta hydrolase [Streptosporangiaceae bacterium]
MASFILVHSPLVGPASWKPAAASLAGRGHDVLIPDLTGTVAGGPPYCAPQAGVIAAAAAGAVAAGPVLVGHSGAGPLLGVAAGLLADVGGFIFVDAGLPIPGQSWMQTVPADLVAEVRDMADGDGWLPPWPRWWPEEVLAELLPGQAARQEFAGDCPRLPLAMFEEVHPPAPGWPQAPAGYLRLSEGYAQEAGKARALGWPVTELASHHLAPFTDPELVAGSVL